MTPNTDYPAPGWRGHTTGTLWGICTLGYSYSTATSNTNGIVLDFDTEHLYPSGTTYRACGFQLRCLSE
ncbi:hypothetical protein [uncultured Rikenella sp.]|uniref:hypothetical protein n=1 Tax=uncultured Rikenella sp. TaxID=368003 RepID=UPI0025EB253E|nr:hypothetical protein [uncultured Rikenella sp.]